MAVDPANLDTIEKARNYLANVRRAGRSDLEAAAFRRVCELAGREDTDALVVDFWRAIAAAEEVLREQHGKRVLLGRTRPKVARVGAHQTIVDLVMSRAPSDGFHILTQAGLADLTAEWLTLKHADRFLPEVREAARARLLAASITFPEASP